MRPGGEGHTSIFPASSIKELEITGKEMVIEYPMKDERETELLPIFEEGK